MKQVVRQRTRSALTICGVGTAMFLFGTIQSLQSGVAAATEEGAAESTLVVYRENRFCPFTSRLPEYYEPRLRAVAGVADVIPMKVVVNNCRTSLDVVTYRGVRKEAFAKTRATELNVVSGSVGDWLQRTDSALVGRTLADRRGFRVGDAFDSSGITVQVAAIFESPEPQDQNVAYVDLEFLQRAPGIDQVGVVTQFNVKVTDPSRLEDTAAAIDAEFENDQDPTFTTSEKAFVARAAADAVELIDFTRWVALGCIGAVMALVANAIVLSVQDRMRDYAVLQTLGFTGRLIGLLIIGEGVLLSLAGGVLGSAGALLLLTFGDFSLSNEGLSMNFHAGPGVWITGLWVSLLVGVLAGLVPAFRAARLPITSAFRAV